MVDEKNMEANTNDFEVMTLSNGEDTYLIVNCWQCQGTGKMNCYRCDRCNGLGKMKAAASDIVTCSRPHAAPPTPGIAAGITVVPDRRCCLCPPCPHDHRRRDTEERAR